MKILEVGSSFSPSPPVCIYGMTLNYSIACYKSLHFDFWMRGTLFDFLTFFLFKLIFWGIFLFLNDKFLLIKKLMQKFLSTLWNKIFFFVFHKIYCCLVAWYLYNREMGTHQDVVLKQIWNNSETREDWTFSFVELTLYCFYLLRSKI